MILFIFFFFFCCCRHDQAKAVEILVKDLKVFSTFNEELFKEITLLLTLQNFRYRIFMLVNLEVVTLKMLEFMIWWIVVFG